MAKSEKSQGRAQKIGKRLYGKAKLTANQKKIKLV
jgi:hypothetical protein